MWNGGLHPLLTKLRSFLNRHHHSVLKTLDTILELMSDPKHDLKSPDEKDIHRMLANITTALILGFGRLAHGIFKFIFSLISSIA